MLRNSLVAARGALTGAARGLSTAVAAAAAHRAFAVPRPAGAALTATLPAPATLAAEDELTLAPAAPIASKLREINARLVRRVTSELRAYHEARGALPPRRNGAGLDRDGAESAAPSCVPRRSAATSAAPSSCIAPRAARWATSRSRRSSKLSSHRTAVARPSPSGATAPPAGSACPGARSFR